MKKSPSYTELTYLYQQKHQKLLEKFSLCNTPQKIYEKIIELGRLLPPLPASLKTPESLVSGCQSEVYLIASLGPDGTILFQVHSDALISSGLAALLLAIYQGEPPEMLLLCPPLFIEDLGLSKALSPGRSNGLASIYLRMKHEAIQLIAKQRSH